jgi:hypothetical protein
MWHLVRYRRNPIEEGPAWEVKTTAVYASIVIPGLDPGIRHDLTLPFNCYQLGDSKEFLFCS